MIDEEIQIRSIEADIAHLNYRMITSGRFIEQRNLQNRIKHLEDLKAQKESELRIRNGKHAGVNANG